MLRFLCHFGLKTGIHFAYFGLESGMVFKGTTGLYECIYRFNSKWVTKKEKYANSKWILRNLFCCCSNLRNNDIISYWPGLNKGVKRWHFFAWNSVRVWRAGRHTLAKISQEYPPRHDPTSRQCIKSVSRQVSISTFFLAWSLDQI